MWVVAHRGGAELYPENSMTAFTKLAEMGVDLVECDVHVSRDGELVVIHDGNLLRTAGIDKPVSELTLAELRQIDIGDGRGVPSLSDVIDAISIPVAVELKTPQTVESLTRLLAARPALIERIVPLSFFHDILLHLAKAFPGLQCGALLAGYPVDPVAVARSAGCTMLSLHFEGVTKAYVDRCHQGGILVSVWTPNREEDIRRMVEAGVDAIGSDRPDLVLKLVGRHSG